MHTDRKIGFAMGILLIGIVAALFFRNEPLLSTKVPGVRRERELNQRLRERDAAIYLNDKVSDTGSEFVQDDQPWTLRDVLKKMDERNKTVPVPVGAHSFAQRTSDEFNDEELDGYRPKKRRNQVSSDDGASAAAVRIAETIPDTLNSARRELGPLPPLPPVEAPAVRLTAPPATTTDVSGFPQGEVAAGSDAPDFDFQPPESFDEYVVKYGDTLSGIAQRTLGSQKKYIEIYNANRDRMASPDRLDVGKPLRIPRVAESGRLRL